MFRTKISSRAKYKIVVLMLGIGLIFGACEEIIEVPDISSERVVLLAPLTNTEVTDNVVTFSWEELLEADEYQLQVASPDFANAAQVLLDSIIVVDSTFAGPRGILELSDGPYEWRVRAQNSAYNTSHTRSAFTVNTGN